MNTETIIKQLEKALKCKNEELRIRVEILLDMMKGNEEMRAPIRTQYKQPFEPVQQPIQQPKVTGKKGQVRGAGPITSFDTEQISYSRPKGT